MYIDLSTCDGLITTMEEMVSSCSKIQHLLDNMTLILNSNSLYTATTSVMDEAMVTSVAASGGTVVCTICNIFLEELYLIHQIATVDEFHQQFEALRTRISIEHPELPEEFFISLFISGSRKDVQHYVEDFCPCTVLDAYHVACIHEYSLRADATSSAPMVNEVSSLQFCASDALRDVDKGVHSMHSLVVYTDNAQTMGDVSNSPSECHCGNGVVMVNTAMPCTEMTTAIGGVHSFQGLVPSARVLVPMDYVANSWVGTTVGRHLLEPQLQVEFTASRLCYNIPASSVVSASTWTNFFTSAVRSTVCFDPGITASSVTSNVHNGSSSQQIRGTDVATSFQQAQQSLAKAFEVVPGLGKGLLQSTAVIIWYWCDSHGGDSLAKAQSYESHCTIVVANFQKANLYVKNWNDIIVWHLEELFSEFGSDIILLILQQNATHFFAMALTVDVPESVFLVLSFLPLQTLSYC